jgi:hypothetical protein
MIGRPDYLNRFEDGGARRTPGREIRFADSPGDPMVTQEEKSSEVWDTIGRPGSRGSWPRKLAWLVGLTVAAAPSFIAAQGPDTIEPRQGRDIRCTIQATSATAIQYEIAGNPQSIPVGDIKGLKFGGEPGEFGRARNRIQSGQFDDGLAELQKVNPAALPELVRVELDYLTALGKARKALRDGSLPLREAATAVNQFLQSHADSIHVLEMTEIFGWMAFHSAEFAAADKSFQALVDAQASPFELAGHFGLARSAIEQANWDAAGTQLTAIASNDANDDAAQELKLVGRALAARVNAERGQAVEGIKELEQIIQSENSERSRVFANVYNALGVCHLRAGNLKGAERAFLHTELLYSGEADLHAEALHYLAGLWAQANETDKSNRARQTLNQQYRNSLWASRK